MSGNLERPVAAVGLRPQALLGHEPLECFHGCGNIRSMLHEVLSERFEIVRTLARGSTAEVIEARDKGRRRVAIKVLHTSSSADKELVARFKREARAASMLRSPNVVRLLEMGATEAGRPYLVMEFLVGRDLATEIAVRGPLPLEEAASFLAQTCAAMIEAHHAGIIHRDLKPTNLFIAEEREERVLKVLDFGIAKLTKSVSDGPITEVRAVFGSPLYMAPELFRSAKLADARSDIWSLGVIFYEMLTGALPFDGKTVLDLATNAERKAHLPPTARRRDLPSSVDVVIARALKKDPSDRYQSVRELLAALEVFLPNGEPTVAARAPSRPGDTSVEGVPTRSYPPGAGSPTERVTARPPDAQTALGASAEAPPLRASEPDASLVETGHGFGLSSDSIPPAPIRPPTRHRAVRWAAALGASALVVAVWLAVRPEPNAPAPQTSSANQPASPPAPTDMPKKVEPAPEPAPGDAEAAPAPPSNGVEPAPVESASPQTASEKRNRRAPKQPMKKRRWSPTRI
jgi:serine/threonine-protein kinase